MSSEATATPGSSVPRIVGRSSSHFTRVVRLFAHECDVAYEFTVVPDLLATDVTAFGGNPGLKLPNMVIPSGVVFGSLNCCRVLAERATTPPTVVWPEHVRSRVAANAQELTLQAMASEVSLILATANAAPETTFSTKLRAALIGTVEWLEVNVEQALSELPARDVSYFEAALFSLVEHLEFRRVLAMDEYRRLQTFARQWGKRSSAVATPFRFD